MSGEKIMGMKVVSNDPSHYFEGRQRAIEFARYWLKSASKELVAINGGGILHPTAWVAGTKLAEWFEASAITKIHRAASEVT